MDHKLILLGVKKQRSEALYDKCYNIVKIHYKIDTSYLNYMNII